MPEWQQALPVKNLAYTLLIGFPLCVMLCTIGLVFICTIVLAPVGLACIGLGMKALTLTPRPIVR